MQGWQTTYFGLRELPRESSAFEGVVLLAPLLKQHDVHAQLGRAGGTRQARHAAAYHNQIEHRSAGPG